MTTLFVLLKHSKATDWDHNLIVQDTVQTGQKNYPYTRRNVTSIKQQSSFTLMWEYKENDHLCHINNIIIILGTLGSWLISNIFGEPSKRVQSWKHLELSVRKLCWCMWAWPSWRTVWRIPASCVLIFLTVVNLILWVFFWSI